MTMDEQQPQAVAPVYVGGFLARYDQSPDEAELLLPRDVVEHWLYAQSQGQSSLSVALPLNINHDDTAVVGHVAAMQSVRDGLFCLGCVTSPRFLEIVRRASEKSELVSRGPVSPLQPDKVVEFLSGSYAGLSLSSRRCDDVEAATSLSGSETTPFKHVALCSVGRRRGTLAVYGRDPEWVTQRFPDLTAADRDGLRAQWQRCGSTAVDASGDPFRSDSYGLLGNSVDALYIRERLPKLRYDKQLVGVTERESYVKASVSPEAACDIKAASAERSGDSRSQAATPAAGARVPSSSPSPPVEPPSPVQPPALPASPSVLPAESPPSLSPSEPAEAASMSHPLSAAVTAATAPPGATVAGASPAVPSLAWPHDGVYLPKDAFFSLLGASRSAAPVMYPGAVAAPPSASPAPLPLPSYPASYGAPVVGYDQLAARHFADYVDPHYPGWGRRYEPAPPLHPSYPVPPPPSPAYYRRRDSPGGMDEPPSGWERYDGGHRGHSQKQHRHGGSGGHNKRRKEAAAASSSSSDEDLSFPGEAEHGRARKRLKSHVNSDGGSGGHAGSNQQQQQRYDELRDAIHELKRDLFAARQSSTLLSAALPAAASSSPTTTTVCTPTGELTSGGGETPTALLSGGAKVAERAQAGVVNASCRLATASGSEAATAGPSTTGSSSCPASVVLAAAAAQAAAASQSPPKDMVDLNRRIFVAALNKLE